MRGMRINQSVRVCLFVCDHERSPSGALPVSIVLGRQYNLTGPAFGRRIGMELLVSIQIPTQMLPMCVFLQKYVFYSVDLLFYQFVNLMNC